MWLAATCERGHQQDLIGQSILLLFIWLVAIPAGEAPHWPVRSVICAVIGCYTCEGGSHWPVRPVICAVIGCYTCEGGPQEDLIAWIIFGEETLLAVALQLLGSN